MAIKRKRQDYLAPPRSLDYVKSHYIFLPIFVSFLQLGIALNGTRCIYTTAEESTFEFAFRIAVNPTCKTCFCTLRCLLRLLSSFYYLFASLYCSSVTGSSHSFDSGSPTWTCLARCWNHESLVAPCQCFAPSGMSMMSPA